MHNYMLNNQSQKIANDLSKTIKLTYTQGSSELEQVNMVMPLYYTEFLLSKI